MMREVLEPALQAAAERGPAAAVPACAVCACGGGPDDLRRRTLAPADRRRGRGRRRTSHPGPISSSSMAGGASSPPRRRRSLRSASPTCLCSAVAKGPDRDAGLETFFVPGREPFKLKPRDPVLYFVQRLRDEAHRFAIGSHRAAAHDATSARPACRKSPASGRRASARCCITSGRSRRSSARRFPISHKVPGISAETARKIYDFFHERAR